ncbi:hypothetical protein JUJ52_10410 [Virgibacillus sp. AGTR]|uniref:hypothetical protein n=1 Tax=Virgibacillus sp. AGTR TaxID=2812055 RepID=UPI001D16F471|nr:hypothetical protein [Virgibacillus sp. AGTR]MCC2250377.1 hypothetical protein [Virgibacillus sp. AGTR]
MKMSKELEQLLKDYQTEDKEAQQRSEKTAKQVEELTDELAETKAKLAEAVDKSLENPTDHNAQAEHELRKKVAELELQLQGAQHKKSRAFGFNTSRKKGLAKQATEKAKQEAHKYYNDKQPKAAKKIEEAKLAYLNALADYHDLAKEAAQLQRDIAQQVGYQLDNSDLVSNVSLYPFNFQGSRQVYGITEPEVLRAYKNGIIRKNSVAEGKQRGVDL